MQTTIKSDFFGAKATVYLQFEGKLENLATLLSEKLFLPEFWYKNDQDPPHDVCALTETLGFETWLRESSDVEGYNFVFIIETDMDVEDSFKYELFDLSPWFAKEISRLSNIETYFQN